MRIGLEPCVWERSGASLLVVCDSSRQIELYDPAGHAQTMLKGGESRMKIEIRRVEPVKATINVPDS
jgi:hypothetical protein